MRYVKSKYKRYSEDFAYRIYVTDCLYYQGQSKALTTRFIDFVHPKPVDTRTGDEIALDVINRLGLVVE